MPEVLIRYYMLSDGKAEFRTATGPLISEYFPFCDPEKPDVWELGRSVPDPSSYTLDITLEEKYWPALEAAGWKRLNQSAPLAPKSMTVEEILSAISKYSQATV